jgi:hypothetical protein
LPQASRVPYTHRMAQEEHPRSLVERLRLLVDQEVNLMTAVATGGPRIQFVNDEYIEQRAQIRELLEKLGLEDPNPYPDLWVWYGKWSRDLPGYQSRRAHLRMLYAPLYAAMQDLLRERVGSELPGSEVTGWAAVDGQVAQLRRRLAAGRTSEDGQAIGLLCRDIMVTLADACHNPAVHGDVGASAVERLNAVADYLAPGEENQRLRKLLKATLDYANVVQHHRQGTLVEAGLVAEATVAAVNLMRRLTSAFKNT